MGTHISDTGTMRWETYHVHMQSGHTLSVDMLCQASASYPAAAAVCSGKSLQTDIDR